MAWTAHRNSEDIQEHFCDDKTLDEHAKTLANLIKNAQHFVAFTGAGISTSAGISDFRGPKGVWTMRAQGKQAVSSTSTMEAFPTAGHMALQCLEEAGYLKFLISQNCDGLHRRSGFPPEKLAELHGNSNLESCGACGKQYLRDYRCSRRNIVKDHSTGRQCICGSELYDTVVNFGENLPPKPMNDGFSHAENADLMLVLGSSLTVTPAADIPARVAKRGKSLVICNLQKTPLDSGSAFRVFAKSDDLMVRVLRYLGLELPSWKLTRQVVFETTKNFEKSAAEVGKKCFRSSAEFSVAGIEPDGTPASIFSSVEIGWNRRGNVPRRDKLTVEPFSQRISWHGSNGTEVSVELAFMGHYKEPPVEIETVFGQESEKQVFKMEFDPITSGWDVKRL